MTLLHSHHHHGHNHDHGHDHQLPLPQSAARPRAPRFIVAALALAAAVTAACVVMVEAGQAVVVTRFGNPVRVVTQPGLSWHLPVPIEDTVQAGRRHARWAARPGPGLYRMAGAG
jgi:membrane protease subunit HflC